MAWSYSAADLNTTTASGRTNTVRLLIGDVVTTDQQLQDEEIIFALGENGNNVYLAAAYCCRLLASKYARLVDTQLDGALQASYSDRIKHYNLLFSQLTDLSKKTGGRGLGISAGGISILDMEAADADPDRVKPAFTIGQFANPGAGYIPDEA
jgi:hypothetical protein